MIDKKLIFEATLGKVIPTQESEQTDEASSSAEGQLGFSSSNMLRQMSLIIMAITASGILGTIFVFIYLFLYKKWNKYLKKIVDFARYKIFFNTLLRTSIMQYLDISISSMIALRTFC